MDVREWRERERVCVRRGGGVLVCGKLGDCFRGGIWRVEYGFEGQWGGEGGMEAGRGCCGS